MHRLQRTMARPDRERVGGPGVNVEMDCTFIEGVTKDRNKRYAITHKPVVLISSPNPAHKELPAVLRVAPLVFARDGLRLSIRGADRAARATGSAS